MATDPLIKIIETMAGHGIPHDQIAASIGVTEEQLLKDYSEVLAVSLAQTNYEVAKQLLKKAKLGDVSAMKFWLERKGGWIQNIDLNSDVKVSPKSLDDFYSEVENNK